LLSACRSSAAREIAHAPGADPTAAKLEMLNPTIEGVDPNRALVLTLHNLTDERVATGMAIDWFDATGKRTPLQSTAWIPLVVEGRAFSAVRVAPMPVEARSWRLRFSSSER
jgi:uncharacterized protein YcfL